MIKPHERQYVWKKGIDKSLINSHFLFCRGTPDELKHDIEIIAVRKNTTYKRTHFLVEPHDTEENFVDPNTIYEYYYTYDIC